MFVCPGDRVAGSDGREWIVTGVHGPELALWNEERGAWRGVPSGPVKVVWVPEDAALAVLREAFPQITKVSGAILGSLVYERMKIDQVT